MLIPWQPFLEPFENFEKFFNNANKNMPVGISPAVDIYEKGNYIIVETPLAGIDPEKVEVSIENDILTMQGKMEKKTEVEEKNYYRKEISTGSFYRQIPLPKPVLGDKAEASYESGVLKVTVPKAPEKKSKKIAVKVIKNKK
ncbi:MAG: Heat shock protein Hsp20 [Parcubacteria group bacterium GW2011_GWC2_38_7]|nr:MAG: Heat shock protein Hsp20 [Parcubacteria group bacterium GW2011_GWC2_38_7]